MARWFLGFDGFSRIALPDRRIVSAAMTSAGGFSSDRFYLSGLDIP
jgi:hypothetical protein